MNIMSGHQYNEIYSRDTGIMINLKLGDNSEYYEMKIKEIREALDWATKTVSDLDNSLDFWDSGRAQEIRAKFNLDVNEVN